MNFSQVLSVKDQINVKHLTGLLIPMLILLIILMMVVPLPAFLLDLFFTLNIALVGLELRKCEPQYCPCPSHCNDFY